MLFTQGLTYPQIGDRIGKSVSTVKRYITHALKTESSFPVTLSPEEVGQLRQVQSELLLNAMSKLIRRVDIMDQDPEIANDKKVQGHAAAVKALSLANVRLSSMNGLDQPQEMVAKMLNVNINRSEVTGRLEVSFDRDQLRPNWKPLGLTDVNGQPYERLTDGGGYDQ